MTRSRDIADQQENLGGAVAPFVGAKNFAFNGSFDIWQRGTSVTGGNGVYTADRWLTFTDGEVRTVSRQATNDTTNLPNIQYCARFQRANGNTGTGRLVLGQGFETANSIPLAGKTVTLSFYARAGANFSATSSILYSTIQNGTGTDQNIFVGYTGNNNIVSQNNTLTTTWQRFTVTGTVPTNSTELGFQFGYTPTGTAGANDYYEITGVQLEIGSAATPFSRAGGSIGGELALCQRYYYRLGAGGGGNTAGVQFGYYLDATASSSTNLWGILPLPVTMRKTPSSVDYGSVGWITTWGAGVNTISVIAIYDGSNVVGSNPQSVVFQMTTTGATSGNRYPVLSNNQTAGYLGVSAEL